MVLPDFAWVEVGSVLRQKINRKLITLEQAEIAWEEFGNLGMTYISNTSVMRAAWRIAEKEKLPTLYDAAYIALSDIISRQENDICEFWTADEKLFNSISDKKQVRLLRSMGEEINR